MAESPDTRCCAAVMGEVLNVIEASSAGIDRISIGTGDYWLCGWERFRAGEDCQWEGIAGGKGSRWERGCRGTGGLGAASSTDPEGREDSGQ